MSTEAKNNRSIYSDERVVIALLILIPPLGIPLFIKYYDGLRNKLKIAISIAWFILWSAMMVTVYFDNLTYRKYGESRIECGEGCSYITSNYPDLLEVLTMIGVEKVDKVPRKIQDRYDVEVDGGTALSFEMDNDKVIKVYHRDYSQVVFFPQNDNTYQYPATDKISKLKSEEEELAREQRQKSEGEKAKAESEKQKSDKEKEEFRRNNISEEDYPEVIEFIKGHIKSTLKSPSTAKFDDGFLYDKWVKADYGNFTLFKGSVDSENGFGAIIRTNFEVHACKRDNKYGYSRLIMGDESIIDNSNCS